MIKRFFKLLTLFISLTFFSQFCPASPIESMFDLNLKQVGYDVFANVNSLSGNSKFNSDYTLNVGEKLNIYLYGESVDVLSMSGSNSVQPLTTSQVDSKGNIFVPGVGMVKAEGRTIGDVEKSIQSLAKSKYKNMSVKINVSSDTDFCVYVFGQVNNPGKVVVTSNASILEALGAAGGVKKSGSLRNITYTDKNGRKINLDLYDLLFNNKKPSVTLQANDVIYVNNIGSVVAITNGVNVPGIYELLKNETVDTLIKYAGGETPNTDLSTLTIMQFDSATGQRHSMDISHSQIKKQTLINGDIVSLRSKFNQAQDYITIEGNVKHPMIMAYKDGMRLSDVLKNQTELKDETFLHQAVITRVEGENREVITIPISLKDLFAGKDDITLQPLDKITVLKNTNLTFIDVNGCINTPKKYPYKPGMTLKTIMAGLQFNISADNKQSEVQANTVFDNSQNDVKEQPSDIQTENNTENNITNNNEKMAVVEVIPDQTEQQSVQINYTPVNAADIAVEITNVNGHTSTYYLYDIMISENQLSTVVINEGDRVFFRPLRDTEVLKTVNVSGFVNRPGVYRFVKGKKLVDMINEAGGLADNSDLRGLVLTRSYIAKQQKKIARENNEKDLRELEAVMAGGDVFSASKTDLANQKAVKDSIEESQNSLNQRYDARISLDIDTQDLNKIDSKVNIDILDGDQIYVPRYSSHVSVIGEVYNETAFEYKKGMKSKAYIKASGGFTTVARKTKVYKVGVNGKSKRLGLFANKSVEAGDTIVVPRKIRGNDWLSPVLHTVQAVASVLSAIYVITKI